MKRAYKKAEEGVRVTMSLASIMQKILEE